MEQRTPDDLERAYAEHMGARETRFVAGADPEDALACAGLLREGDLLVAFRSGSSRQSSAAYARCTVDSLDASAFRAASVDVGAQARLFWLVPATGGLGIRVSDVRSLAGEAGECGAVLAIDVTSVSSFAARPLGAGANLVLERLGEAFALSTGFPSRRHRGIDGRAAWVTSALAGVPAFTCRFPEQMRARLRDLDRVQTRMDSARALAEYLAANEMVSEVSYPGLVSHPDHDVAASNLLHGFGYRIDACLPRGLGAERFIETLPASMQPPFSGAEGTRVVAARGLNEPYIRLVAGLDDPLCIVDSLDQALRLYCNPPEPL